MHSRQCYETRVTCFEQALNKPYTLHKHAHTKDSVRVQNIMMVGIYPISWAYKLYYMYMYNMSTTMLKRDLGTGDLCDNIGLVGVSAKWSYMYVTASPSHHDQAIPILSPLHVGYPNIPLCRIFIYLYIDISMCMYVGVSMCVCIYACTRTYHIYIHVFCQWIMYMYIHVHWICRCVHVHVCVCVYVHFGTTCVYHMYTCWGTQVCVYACFLLRTSERGHYRSSHHMSITSQNSTHTCTCTYISWISCTQCTYIHSVCTVEPLNNGHMEKYTILTCMTYILANLYKYLCRTVC